MQVSHVQDHISHAVIGGGQSIEFGISNSAEFFNILSSTLYKDQILAVVREVLCNAWDAHIEAGLQHKPVEITLDETKFVIKDFGKGIHKDDMGIIYGTYGNSTKKNDGTQTGGFGLGCKAPFAYTDHFEVISCHDGVKTIYNLSKSSAQAMGKPGIIPIASFPTTDTGLQVSISIKSYENYRRFLELIKRIVHNGDMHMTLNGKPLSKLDFDVNKANYLVTSNNQLLDGQPKIMVRYGNVVYPVDLSDAISNEYSQINQFLGQMETRYNKLYVVFQAPPHSISVTPSRESLSMQEHTTKTLLALFTEFLKMTNTGFKKNCEAHTVNIIQQAVKDQRVDLLLSPKEQLPKPITPETSTPTKLNELMGLAELYLRQNYPKGKDFRIKDITVRLETMVAAGMLDRGKVSTFLSAMHDFFSTSSPHESDWVQRRIIAPLMKKMLNKKIDTDRLYVLDPDDRNWVSSMGDRVSVPLVRADNSLLRSISNGLPYLRNIVVVGTSRNNITERAYRHEVFTKLGKFHGFLFYHASMKKSEKEAALAFFKDQGMQVVDLTVKQPWEGTTMVTPRAPRGPVKKGVTSLASVYSEKTRGIWLTNLAEDDAPRIDNPEFILQVTLQKGFAKSMLPHWDVSHSRVILELFGQKGAITNNAAVANTWLKKGVKPFDDYILENVTMEMLTNPRIQEYWAYEPERVIVHLKVSGANEMLLKTIYARKELRNLFGLVNNLTKEDQQYISLWRYLVENRYGYTKPQVVKDCMNQLMQIPLAKENRALADKLYKTKLLPLLSFTGVSDLLKTAETTNNPSLAQKTIDILTTILNG